MNRVKYTGYPVEKYPLSTKEIDFIQEQIFLAAEYAKSAGGNFILSGCRPEGNSISAGTVIIDGEILPLKAGVAQPYIRIAEGRETLTGDGIVYENARTLRWVEFGEGDTACLTGATKNRSPGWLRTVLRPGKSIARTGKYGFGAKKTSTCP